MFRIATVLVPAALIALAGCGSESADRSAKQPAEENPSWLLASAPENAAGVAAAKQSAAEGDEVVLRGVIGGRVSPMTEGSATFILMDTGLPSCADMEEDHCATPWDYCCETDDTIQANSATVQLVDESGRPAPIDLASYGFAPLDEVVVVGTVGPRPTEGVLVVKATSIHRVGG